MATFKVKACGQGWHLFNDSAGTVSNQFCIYLQNSSDGAHRLSLDAEGLIVTDWTASQNIIADGNKKLQTVAPAGAISNLAGSPTNEQLSTAVNAILAALRTHKIIAT